ncbi:MAG TPA: Ldh family oxidoreductase [Mesorhizobium sp.]|nr:Ldh family oxidoreductase [Mesorhizobium sp.]
MERAPTVRLALDEAETLCREAAMRAGASRPQAEALARSVAAAEAEGNASVGLAHLLDYLDAIRAGRLKGQAEPKLERPAPALFLSDAGGGSAHLGFERALGDLAAAAKTLGLALFSQKNAFTCGALGYFAARLAEHDLVALAATNGPALLAVPGAKQSIYCTNPLSFAAPLEGGPPLLFDQSSSPLAFVKLREMAACGETLPEGWAIDVDGEPTADARAAVKGALLAFGGPRGANIALMVEVLAAGLSGANWSLDAPSFSSGEDCPGTGLFVLALAPALLDPDFTARMKAQAERLDALGVHVPGRRRAEALARAEREGLFVSRALIDKIAAA